MGVIKKEFKQETEITVECFDSLDDINTKLLNEGFEMVERFQLNDWYFSALTDQQIEATDYLTVLNNSFLVRNVITIDRNYVCVQHKSKVLDENGNVIEEIKTESEVLNLENAVKIFKTSGLNLWAETKNTSYVFKKGEIEICIQVLPGLGVFVEFEEFDRIKNLPPKQKFNEIVKIVKTIGLTLGEDFSCKKNMMQFKNRMAGNKV